MAIRGRADSLGLGLDCTALQKSHSALALEPLGQPPLTPMALKQPGTGTVQRRGRLQKPLKPPPVLFSRESQEDLSRFGGPREGVSGGGGSFAERSRMGARGGISRGVDANLERLAEFSFG
jgi:hypothetical protein